MSAVAQTWAPATSRAGRRYQLRPDDEILPNERLARQAVDLLLALHAGLLDELHGQEHLRYCAGHEGLARAGGLHHVRLRELGLPLGSRPDVLDEGARERDVAGLWRMLQRLAWVHAKPHYSVVYSCQTVIYSVGEPGIEPGLPGPKPGVPP